MHTSILSRGHNSHTWLISTLPKLLTPNSLIFICLLLFHLDPIKTSLQTNCSFLTDHTCLLIHCSDTMTAKRLSSHKTPNHRRGCDTVCIKVLFDSFFFLFIFLYQGFDSRSASSPSFLWLCPPLTITATLSHHFHSSLTTGCNYLTREPGYLGLTPSHVFLLLSMCGDISPWISICPFAPVAVCRGLIVHLAGQFSDRLTENQTFFWLKWNCGRNKQDEEHFLTLCYVAENEFSYTRNMSNSLISNRWDAV